MNRGVPQGSVLGPMLFNVHINDLFYEIKLGNLNAYADDEQLYSSNCDPEVLERTVKHELRIINTWYTRNGMIINPDKHQAMVLGKHDYNFSFPVKDMIELLGAKIDKELNFNCHVSEICSKVNNQFSVLRRFKNLLQRKLILKLYKVYVLPHFRYCSLVWHFCAKRNSDKLESLNRQILRHLFQDVDSSYEELLNKANTATLHNERIQSIYAYLSV